jgi:hypothetical protein
LVGRINVQYCLIVVDLSFVLGHAVFTRRELPMFRNIFGSDADLSSFHHVLERGKNGTYSADCRLYLTKIVSF